MKLRKAMAVALAGALVLTTFATGTTSEAAKKTKTKLKTKKVSVFVKKSKKISIKGKKENHKYTFKSKDKKIAKVSSKGKITGVKAGKTTITVKDTWKQGSKKKSKTLGKVKVTVKAKKVVPKVTPAVTTQAPAVPATAAPSQAPGITNAPQSQAPATLTPPATTKPAPSKKPGASKTPVKTETPTSPPPAPEEQVATTYAPADMSAELQIPSGAVGEGGKLEYDAETNSIVAENVTEFGIPLGYQVMNGHSLWVHVKGEITGDNGFRCWLHDEVNLKDRSSDIWQKYVDEWEKYSPMERPIVFDETFQLTSYSDTTTHLWFKGPQHGVAISGIKITSVEISYPLGSTPPTPVDPDTLSADITVGNMAVGDTKTAVVSVEGEGTVKDVEWSVKDAAIATVTKDAADPKQAAVKGVSAGKTEINAKVTVTAGGKDITLTAVKEVTVAGEDEVVVNAKIETAPAEVIVGDSADLAVSVDTGTIESVVWTVEGAGATIETDDVEAAKAVLKTTKIGKVTVSATVTVEKDGKTGEATATKVIKVIKDPSDIIQIDITKNISVAGWGKPAAYEVQKDGTVKCTWSDETDSYTFVKFSFDKMDLTGYYCVIDAEGDNMNIDIHDAERKEPTYGNPYSVTKPVYWQAFPYQVKLDSEALNPDKDNEDKDPDYHNVGGVNIYRGESGSECSLTVKSITFYKYEEDIPKA